MSADTEAAYLTPRVWMRAPLAHISHLLRAPADGMARTRCDLIRYAASQTRCTTKVEVDRWRPDPWSMRCQICVALTYG